MTLHAPPPPRRYLLAAPMAAVAFGIAGCAGTSSTSSNEGDVPTVLTTLGDEVSLRDPFLWPVSSSSPWNTPIGGDAEFSQADSQQTINLIDRTIDIWLNFDEWSHPIVRAESTDPAWTISYANSNTGGPGAGAVTLQLPPHAEPAVGADAHLHVVDIDGVTAREFFGLELTEEQEGRATYFVENDLRGPGTGSGGTRAYGGSALGGLIRAWEMEERRIGHALALSLQGSQLMTGPVWPATAQDSTADATYGGTVPIGTLIAIPPSVNVDAMLLSPEALVVARALQEYGAYIVDQSTVMTFYAEPSLLASEVEAIRADLGRIRRELRLVVNNTEDSPGGGGRPVAPLAPPLEVN
jgi:hypothetical protein